MGNFHRSREIKDLKAKRNSISETQSINNRGHVSISVYLPEGTGTKNCYPMKLKRCKSKEGFLFHQ